MKIEKNGKYTTREGEPVRIYSIEENGKYPVHGVYLSEVAGWYDASWTMSGRKIGDDYECRHDLVPYTPPKKTPKYWSEPSHFPAQAWIMRPYWEGCAQITKVDWRLKKIHCAGYSGFDFDKLPECRWSERMFSSHNEGKECVVES